AQSANTSGPPRTITQNGLTPASSGNLALGVFGGTDLPEPTCATPSAQPTALVLTPQASPRTQINGSFTAASPVADGYLVVRTATSTAPTNPSNGTTYTAGTSALGGFIESYGISTTFTSTGLTTGTQ